MHGGIVASVGAGPQREWTETWSLDAVGGKFRQTSTVYDESEYFYFKVVDADAAFAIALEGGPDSGTVGTRARSLYLEALRGDGLTDWNKTSAHTKYSDHDRIDAYILFKLARLAEVDGDIEAANELLARAAAATGEGLFSGMAAAYLADRRCEAVTDYLSKRPGRLRDAWAFGYTNPAPGPSAVCGETS